MGNTLRRPLLGRYAALGDLLKGSPHKVNGEVARTEFVAGIGKKELERCWLDGTGDWEVVWCVVYNGHARAELC